MPGLSLRPDALSVRGLFSFLRDLDLDCDINPCAAWIGALDPERADDPAGVVELLRAFGLTGALAHLLGIDESEVTATCVVHETPMDGGTDQLAEPMSDYHNGRPLRLDEAALIACWPRSDGEHVVFVKLNHLVVDLGDAVAVLKAVRAHLRGTAPRRVGARYRDHAALVARYAALPPADPDVVEKALGAVPEPGRRGIPVISESSEQWLPLRRGISFDDLLSTVTDIVLRTIGGGLVLQYPVSRWEFARKGGYFVEIKPLVVRGESAADYTPEYFRQTRDFYDSLGRFSLSDLPSFGAALARARMPRIVVSDTTLMRPEPDLWQWIPVRTHRIFDDLKFLADRSMPGPPLLRLQYKNRFLPPEVVTDILGRLDERVGTGGGPHGHAG
ncbi:hypothetical protein E4198_08585 [Streptomyces sp. RKND-216]|uniref:hypothetical protein n=1 Tax=Streptomyces sp. RKND-216 TaxID=2562581 RepID=UPI00109DA6E6|nr:hypothetical protein [Streptomyces sp. RKND-216]THA24788.1 hypothetical protein E4198_08585 [Streptomyces sp. RKND-216]